MNQYQKEQMETLCMVRSNLDVVGMHESEKIKAEIADYLNFRSNITSFLEIHFNRICTEKCYTGRLSACCSKDGIITFFGDVVVNVLISNNKDLDNLEQAIKRPEHENKCIYLSDNGCLWQIKPIVCEMFLCGEAANKVFDDNIDAKKQWEAFKTIKKKFTWPDKPVLFETLESFFLEKGVKSPLMYIHYSPGLLRIKNSRDRQENM